MRCVLLLLAFGVGACAAAPGEAGRDGPARELRVLSYNIHHGRGTDGAIDLPRIARVIAATRPDLVALQEVDRGTGRANGVDQADALGELTGLAAEALRTALD